MVDLGVLIMAACNGVNSLVNNYFTVNYVGFGMFNNIKINNPGLIVHIVMHKKTPFSLLGKGI
ncbi:hypothetical protein AEM51_08800 [Bacteroidetes bacterium UKL13-3]|nr:hypothetical protein AEM51_08800 [Bacteroidetes bacterium UKL13-3]HCP94343.1 hypothetical protein [Bacteroidota bacterium]